MAAAVRPESDSLRRRLMPVLFIGVFMAALDTAVVGPAIPVLRATFGVDNREVGLVMSVFVLFSLCSTALMANLSDRYGRRSVYLASVIIFAVGSLLIATSPSFWMIIVSRAIQGIGAGGITPTASAVVGDVFPPLERGRALGLIGATHGMAFVLGPPLASVLMLQLSWHWIFLLNLPIAVLVLYLGMRALPTHQSAGVQPPLDVTGVVVTFSLLSALVLGITRVLDRLVGVTLWPWLFGAVAVLLVLLVMIERRAQQPLIPMLLLANRQLATVYVLATGAGVGMGSVMFLTSIATQAYGVTVKHAGFVLLPLVVCSMVGSMGAGRLLNRVGAKGLLLIGFAMLAMGYGGAAMMGYGLWLFLAATMPVGLGIGIVVGGSLRAIALEEAPTSVRASAQGLINISTAIGTLFAAAAIGAIADSRGGSASGFGFAYVMVAVLMMLTALGTFGLRGGPAAHAAA